MKLLTGLVIFIFLAMMNVGFVLGEDMTKEGTVSGKFPYSGTYKVLSVEGGLMQMNYEVLGLALVDDKSLPTYNTSYHCLGAVYSNKGAYENDAGFCVYVRPDGDKIYMTYKAMGVHGKAAEGTWTFVGGTGKCATIKGNGKLTRYNVRPAAEGTFQGVSIPEGTWKIE